MLSTAHVPPDIGISGGHPWLHPIEYGWLMLTGYMDDENDRRDELVKICELAKKEGCYMAHFDCDAATIDGLETFEW